mmetsp:Transcript_11212/g.24150  ORF Transcript_11212/g.24150 Transcript_11212/m.24150 type:complete len:518 (+) Transcript_11212:34-1587(+)
MFSACWDGSQRLAPADPSVNIISLQPRGLLSYLLASKGDTGLGSSSTVDDVLNSSTSINSKVVFVVGGTSPIGVALCTSLVRHGVHVILGCHEPSKGEALAKQLSHEVTDARVTVLRCDLSSLAQAVQAADAFLALGLPLHALILNAATCRDTFSLTPDGYEQHFGVNHLAQCALAQALLPVLAATAQHAAQAAQQNQPPLSQQSDMSSSTACDDVQGSSAASQGSPPGTDPCSSPSPPQEPQRPGPGAHTRIIFVSCSAHYINYVFLKGARTPASWAGVTSGMRAAQLFMPAQSFGQSKLAQICYVRELASWLRQCNVPVAVHAVHPGVTAHGLKKYAGYGEGTLAYTAKSYLSAAMSSMGVLKTDAQAAASVAFAAFGSLPQVLQPPAEPPACCSSRQQQQGPAACSSGSSDCEQGNNCSSSGSGTGGCKDCGCSSGAAGRQVSGCADKACGLSTSQLPSGLYIEDCNVSLPSPDARHPMTAASVWDVTQQCLAEKLGPGWPGSLTALSTLALKP